MRIALGVDPFAPTETQPMRLAHANDDPLRRPIAPEPHILTATHGYETVLLDPVAGEYYTLNQTGGDVWAALCRGADISELCAELPSRYGVDQNTFRADLTVLLNDMLSARLVRHRSST